MGVFIQNSINLAQELLTEQQPYIPYSKLHPHKHNDRTLEMTSDDPTNAGNHVTSNIAIK